MYGKRIVSALLTAALLAMPMVACSSENAASPAASTAAPAASAGASDAAAPATTAKKPYNIAVIIKATDSDFWQTLLKGANAAMAKEPDTIKVTTYGPASESDIDKQVSILENVVSKKPDAIVIASTSSDATVPALEEAAAAGIPIITCDNKVNTDVYKSFLRTDNKKGGSLAAEQMVAAWKAAGIDPAGKKVVVISAMAGVQVLVDRDAGFVDKIKELVPTIKIIDARYVDNDISKALSTTEDLMTANADLIGVFADNNHTGVGVARAITERKVSSSVMGIAFDSDAEEVSALTSGTLKGIVVQDPYGMGYKGTMYAVDAIEGRSVPKDVDTGATVVTKENMNNPDVVKLLDPSKN